MRRQTSWAKAFASGQDNLFFFEDFERRDDVETFAAGRLAKADETKGVQALAHFAGSLNHDRESHIRPRIKIEYQTTRDFRLRPADSSRDAAQGPRPERQPPDPQPDRFADKACGRQRP